MINRVLLSLVLLLEPASRLVWPWLFSYLVDASRLLVPPTSTLKVTRISCMKKFALALTFALGCALPAWAQTVSGYRFDNFDFANGIRVETPQPVRVKGNKRSARLSANKESVETKGDAAPK